MLIVLLSPTHNSSAKDSRVIDKKNFNESYMQIIGKLCSEPLWKERDCYDAGHCLMIPMDYAFKKNKEDYILLFTHQFDAFFKNYNEDEFIKLGYLTQFHYLYLMSQYCVWASNANIDIENVKKYNNY